jgi:hypothetical protein
VPKKSSSSVELVAGILENYARRGVFRGFSRGPVLNGKATFNILWHRDRSFEFILDSERKTMRFPVVLPEVPKDSDMFREFKEFVASRQSEELPEHRRIDKAKARAQVSTRAGNAGVILTLRASDYEYGARKLVNLVHEVFMVFLYDGRYYEYMVEKFDLDPDKF